MVEPVSPRDLVRQAALIGAAMLAYFGVRNLTVGSADEAFANARSLVRLQDRLGLDWEHAIQGLVVDRGELVTLSNWIYIWGHWPVILSTAVALYVFRRRSFYVLRNAMFISGAVGFLFFALLPLAPPRLLGLGLVDTVTEQSNAYRALQPPGLTNQYAAFPSLGSLWSCGGSDRELRVGPAAARACRGGSSTSRRGETTCGARQRPSETGFDTTFPLQDRVPHGPCVQCR